MPEGNAMNIIDLDEAQKELYFVCLEDWSEEMKEAGGHKVVWYEQKKGKGLRVKLAVDDNGEVGGMIHYLPAAESFIEGEGLYFIPCIWVHGYDKGRGNFRKRGMGKALLAAAEEDARSLGALGLAAWGLALPFWMKASWYKKHGYKKADRVGLMQLLWKPFSDEARPPRWIKTKKTPECVPGKVTVTAFLNGWCPAQNIAFERAKRAAQEFGDSVEFHHIDTSDRTVLQEWGICDDVFIDDKKISTGPPLSYEKIRKHIAKRVKRL